MSAASPSLLAMLSRDQLLHLFSRFSFLTSQPDVKKRIADAVKDKQEAVAVTTAIQEEILIEMGIAKGFHGMRRMAGGQELIVGDMIPMRVSQKNFTNPRLGIACLGKVNAVYENDMDLMIQFYRFIAKEEMAIDEAELEPDEFEDKMHAQHKLQDQQMEMLKQLRNYQPDDQCLILESLHKQLEGTNFDSSGAILTPQKIQEIVRGSGTLAKSSSYF